MKPSKKTKKRIAKEFLFLISTIPVIFFTCLVILIYNFYNEAKKESLESDFEITQIKLNEVQNQKGSRYVLEESQYKLWFELNDKGYYTKSFPEFREQFPDSSRRMAFYEAMLKNSFTQKEPEEFFKTHFPSVNEKVKNEEDSLKTLLSYTEQSINDITIVEFWNGYKQILLKALSIYLILIFPGRYIYLGIKWSFETLKI